MPLMKSASMNGNAPQTAEVFRRRRERLAAVLEKNKLDAFFLSGVSDLYYLTGFLSEGFYGLFSAKGTWLFTSELMAGQVRENTDGCRLVVGKRLSESLKEIRGKAKLKRVG